MYKFRSVSNTKKKVMQAINIKDPVTQIIVALGAVDLAMTVFQARALTSGLLSELIMYTVQLLFITYVLTCLRNGGCNIYSRVIGIILAIMLAVKVWTRTGLGASMPASTAAPAGVVSGTQM